MPYNDGLYFDYRQTVRLDPDKVHPISEDLAFNPSMGPVKRLWDEGKVAVINGIGYPNPNRSHFRSWTYGTPQCRTISAQRDGWASPPASWTRTAKTF